MRARPDVLRVALLSALGLVPACGSKATGTSGDDRNALGQGSSTVSASASLPPEMSATSGADSTQVQPQPPVTAACSPAEPSCAPVASSNVAQEPVPTATTGSQPSASSPPSSGVDGGAVTDAEVPPGMGSGGGCETAGSPDPVTGLERCSNGVLHREEVGTCKSILPRADVDWSTQGPDTTVCATDSDCTELPNGYCTLVGGTPGTSCNYGCTTDAECGPSKVCLCGDPVGTCVDATCVTDADCDAGMLCALWINPNGSGCPATPHLTCQTLGDTCATDADCPGGMFGSFCSGERLIRSCVDIPPVACGRPFLVDGQERRADLVRAAGWCGEPTIGAVEGLSPQLQQLVGERWAQLGLMEHASIAAFARFTLQLLHLGAPLELVVGSQRALADETLHAQACFGLASGYLGRPVGPGPLPTERALDAISLIDVVRLTIREGCIGETVAALEAAEGLAQTHVPAVRHVLEQIQRDEQAHAELAWRFLRWALEVGGLPIRAAIEEEFEAAAGERAPVAAAPLDAPLLAHGLVPDGLRAELRAAALLEVVLPCARALLAPSTVPSRAVTSAAALHARA